MNAPTTLRERLASPLTWYFAGAAVLFVFTAVLGVRFALDMAATSASRTDALAGKQSELKLAEIQTAPLRGLDKRLTMTDKQIKDFYAQRIPSAYSAIETHIDDLQVKSGVRLSRLQYTQGKLGSHLTEIVMDAGVSGDYPQIMRFVNGIERDKTFFVIRTMQLNSSQGGQVNLRLRLSTWLRPADVPKGLPETDSAAAKSPAPSTGAQENEDQQP